MLNLWRYHSSHVSPKCIFLLFIKLQVVILEISPCQIQRLPVWLSVTEALLRDQFSNGSSIQKLLTLANSPIPQMNYPIMENLRSKLLPRVELQIGKSPQKKTSSFYKMLCNGNWFGSLMFPTFLNRELRFTLEL